MLTAGTDLQEIEDFIARDSLLHAITFVDYIVESAETFLKTPLIGRVVPEFNHQDLREVIFRGYRIVYLVQSDEVLVLRVVHGERDLLGLIRREPWDLGGSCLSGCFSRPQAIGLRLPDTSPAYKILCQAETSE